MARHCAEHSGSEVASGVQWGSFRRLVWALSACALMASPPVGADPGDAPPADLFDLPLEQLVELPVTTVAGSASSWFETPAAIYVIRGDEVRRSGLRSLAEVLRMVPGMNVGRVDSRQWGVGAGTGP